MSEFVNFWNGKDTSHAGYLDALKGIAIFAITFVHVGGSNLSGFWGVIGTGATNGVQLFFVISGYLAFASMQHRFPERKEMRWKSVLKWYVKKYIRLFPLFYISILMSLLTKSWSMYWLGNEASVSVKNILTHIFFIHGAFPHYVDSILGVEWYLGALALFFLVTPLLYYFVNSLERSLFILLLVQIVVPYVNKLVKVILPVESDPIIYSAYLEKFGPINQLFVYCLGITLFFTIQKFQEGKSAESPKSRFFLSYELLFFVAIMIYGQLYSKSQLFLLSNSATWGIWFFVLLLSQAIHACPIINNPFFRLCGKYSYGIYLFQFVWINNYGRFITVNSFLGKFAISFFGLLVISVVLTNFIDQPLQRFFNLKLNSIYHRNKSEDS